MIYLKKSKLLNKIKYWIYGLTLTYSFLFFSIYSILGLKFEGSENNSNYIYGYAILSLISCVLGLYSLLKQKFISRINLMFLTLPLIITMIYLIENPKNDFAFRTYLTFISIVFPVILMGLDLAKSQSIDRLYRVLFFVFIIVTLGSIRLIPELISTTLWKLGGVFAGGNTQALSYVISFVYMVGLITFIDSIKTKKSWYFKLTILVSLMVLFFTAILASGRGAFLVILISSVIFILREYKKKSLLKFIPIIVSIYFMYYFLVYSLGERFEDSIGRIFAYINSSGIDMSGTSNRDLFYMQALDLFYENMFFGTGIFKLMQSIGYSHNIFLDILLQGGFFFMMLFIFFIYSFFKKLKKILKHDSKNNLILIFVIYSFILLLFTSIYLNESFFWFSMAYVFSYSFRPQMINGDIEMSKSST